MGEVFENVQSEKYVPSVVEPSFGIGRILYALLEHSLWERVDDEHRVVLSLKPRIAPYKIAILPISNQLNDIAQKIEAMLSGQSVSFDNECNNEQKEDINDDMHYIDNAAFNEGVATWIDDSSSSIGRKYARCDRKGIPFAVSIDFQTQKDLTVTLRERDSTIPQIRVKIDELYDLVSDLARGRKKWKSVLTKYPHHIMQE